MKSLGTHLILDLEHCDAGILNNLSKIRTLLLKAAKEGGATIVGETFHKFAPVGVTGIVSISESHLCVHTWPEYNYASVDIFSCGPNYDVQKSATILIEGLHCKSPRIREIERGLSSHDGFRCSNQ